MTRYWLCLIVLCVTIVMTTSLPTSLMEDVKKADQAMRPKPKRAQEMLMFGNQQNRQTEGASTSYSSASEKRTATSSGLNGLKSALADEEKPSRAKSSGSAFYDRDAYGSFEKNYDYGKALANELGDDAQVWDVSPYSRYYFGEERRKRSEKSAVPTTRAPTIQSSTASFQTPTTTQHSLPIQVKRSVPYYQEPRYKRELNIDPEDVLTLLSLWENERRNRNWRKYANEEYDTVEDEGSLLEDEDPRNALPWMDSPIYSSRRYGVDNLSPSDIGIVRTHPPNYYEQYGNQQQQYDNAAQYSSPQQYGIVYPQRNYFPPEKRYMASRKRSQSYDSYPAQLQLGSQQRGFPYQQRLVY